MIMYVFRALPVIAALGLAACAHPHDEGSMLGKLPAVRSSLPPTEYQPEGDVAPVPEGFDEHIVVVIDPDYTGDQVIMPNSANTVSAGYTYVPGTSASRARPAAESAGARAPSRSSGTVSRPGPTERLRSEMSSGNGRREAW